MSVAPTRGNLIALKERLSLALQGYDLLERKRTVIMRELVSLIEEARKLQEELLKVFEKAYRSLQRANLDLGIESVEEYASGISEFSALKIVFRSVMGVEVPEMEIEGFDTEIPYEIYSTNAALDQAYLAFRKALELVAKVAVIENKVYRLAYEAKKVKKRVNALENVVIPQLKETIKYIQDTLEEQEREEFFKIERLKERVQVGKR
ncbi:V-type ATPase subunit D [Thermotoga sp. Mc24]|uniref:V-type ATP synthase subunit D n=1 Tax=Thermotoga sp. Mc24 TaxID=1231241 RepID=UPI000543C9E6|nr:V-type ATP synthase subunit D [Thermotoga sp. Mc24]KHC92351.1 V-type ATPase subunit D [Thermotoga sp. Mc24]